MPRSSQIAQPGDFGLVGGDHQLAADLVRDAVFAAERDHLPDAVDRQPRLDRPGLVVEAAVQHAAVVAGLMPADAPPFRAR